MWVCSMILIYVNYFMWATWKDSEYMCTFHTFRLNSKFGCSFAPGTICKDLLFIPWIFIRNIVHPKNIHKRHCSFQDYSHKKLVIPRIFTETPHIPKLFPASIINSKVIIENANTIHNILTIRTGIIHYLYRHQFLPIFYVSSHECKIVEAHVRC
jgi:hypothetical protein